MLKRVAVRIVPATLALFLAAAPVAECFTPPRGAEMPCCANMHHDEICGQAGSAAECCNHARTQDSNGVVVAKRHEAPTVMVALLPPGIVAPWPSQVPRFRPIEFDTSPPPRSTPLHIVLSVFRI